MTPAAPPRSPFVTALAWVTMGCSGLLLPISFISLLMLLAGSDGTGSATLTGVFTVVLLPPLAFVAGIGLWRRRRWAWLSMVLLLTALLAVQGVELATPAGPPVTTVSPDGLRTTTFSSGDPMALPLAIACALGLLVLLSPAARRDCQVNLDSVRFVLRDRTTTPDHPPPRGAGATLAGDDWRVEHRGRDAMVYEERHRGRWLHIDIDGELLLGRAHHVIHFASPERWRGYPEWARDRRDEIIGRITSVCRPPGYEYTGLAPAEHATAEATAPRAAAASAAHPAVAAARPPHAAAGTRDMRGMGALAFVVALLLALAAVTAWLVLDGVFTGDTWQPGARASHWHAVSRAESPLSFWASITLYAAVGIAALVFAGLGVRELLAARRSR